MLLLRARVLGALLLAGCGADSAPVPPPPPRPQPGLSSLREDELAARRPPPEGPIRRGPYVQAVGSRSAVVCFELWQEAEGKVDCHGSSRRSRPGTRHEVLLEGLSPGTRYEYTVEPGGVTGSFKSSPEGDADLFFLAWGDCRTYYDRLARLSALAAKELPDFSVHTGDLVDEGTFPEDWDRFFDAAAPLLRTGALWPAMGNHEYEAKLYRDLFVLPEPKRYYTFVAGPAQFFILDGDWAGRKDPAQVAWLKAGLTACRARFRFVVLHQPILSCPCEDYSPETSLYRIFGRLIEEGKVTAVFQGHNHNYQRAERNGIVYLTTGGAGAPLYPVGSLTPETKFARVVNHYVRVRLHDRTMSLEAVDLNGAVFDRDEKTLAP
ncbi:MAG TPA: metallophosphoesterase [Planctomycetota bacterium]|nr:metallophosphoesterase [Planctomycetota bacterium]